MRNKKAINTTPRRMTLPLFQPNGLFSQKLLAPNKRRKVLELAVAGTTSRAHLPHFALRPVVQTPVKRRPRRRPRWPRSGRIARSGGACRGLRASRNHTSKAAGSVSLFQGEHHPWRDNRSCWGPMCTGAIPGSNAVPLQLQ